MSDWRQFISEVCWFVQPGETAVVGEAAPWNRGGVADLPKLSSLLSSATVTPVSIDDKSYELLAWGPPDSRRGWLTVALGGDGVDRVDGVHAAFWTICGGIVERFREPVSWWNNHNEVLTVSAARTPLTEVLADYGFDLPIDPADYYVVGIESNGNLTLANRETGKLLLFAHDHAFSDITPLPNSPEYSLYTFDAIPNLTTWIEACTEAWTNQ